MPSVPPLKPHQLIVALKKLGFAELRQRGSHKQFRHADRTGTTVPFIRGEISLLRSYAPTLVRKIARDIKVEIDEFLRQV